VTDEILDMDHFGFIVIEQKKIKITQIIILKREKDKD